MTTIAIVVGSVFAYVVVAGRVYRLNERLLDSPIDAFMCAALWPFSLPALWLFVGTQRVAAWAERRDRRRSKLPEARVRR